MNLKRILIGLLCLSPLTALASTQEEMLLVMEVARHGARTPQ
jgi:hypothetical protein